MTAIVKDLQTNKVLVFMKGADTSCLPLLRGQDEGQSQRNWAYTNQRLKYYAEQGLRTLLVSRAEHPLEWWEGPNGWGEKYSRAMDALGVEGPTEKGHFKGMQEFLAFQKVLCHGPRNLVLCCTLAFIVDLFSLSMIERKFIVATSIIPRIAPFMRQTPLVVGNKRPMMLYQQRCIIFAHKR